MTTCKNHPTRQATSRCKRCGMPICNDCKMVSEVGVVCSEQCLDAIKTFQDRIKEDVPYASGRRWRRVGSFKSLVVALILLAVVYGLLCLQDGEILGPQDLVDVVAGWYRSFRTYVF